MSREGLTSRTVVATLLLCGAIVLGIGIVRGESSIESYFELKRSRDTLKSTVEGLRAENKTLEDEITRLSNSKSYARKTLRDKYHIVDQDETIIFFAD
jgi:cell division protein FtsB